MATSPNVTLTAPGFRALKLFESTEIKVGAAGATPQRGPRLLSNEATRREMDWLLDARNLGTIRTRSGETFKAETRSLLAATNVALEGLSGADAARVSRAVETLLQVGTEPGAMNSFLKQVEESPKLRGMGELLISVRRHPDAARLLNGLVESGRLSPEATASLLAQDAFWASKPDVLRMLYGQAAGGSQTAGSTLGRLLREGRIDCDLGALQKCLDANPSLAGTLQIELRDIHGTSSDPAASALYARALGRNPASWRTDLGALTSQEPYPIRVDGQPQAPTSPERVGLFQKNLAAQRAAFLREGLATLLKNPTGPGVDEYHQFCHQLLHDTRFAGHTAEVAACLEQLKKASPNGQLSAKGEHALSWARDRQWMIEAAQDPTSRLASPGDRQKLLTTARDWIKANPEGSYEAVGALKALPGLSPEELQGLGDLGTSAVGRELLGHLVTAGKRPETRQRAAEMLAPFLDQAREIPGGRTEAVRLLARQASPEVRNLARVKAPPPSLPNSRLERFQEACQAPLTRLMARAEAGELKGPLGDQLKELGDLTNLYRATQEHVDKSDLAKNAGYIDAGKVQQRLAELLAKPELKATMDGIHAETLRKFSSMHSEVAEHARQLGSEETYARLQLMPETDRKAFVDGELAKLKSVDPALAAQAAEALRTRERLDDPKAQAAGLQALLDCKPEDQEKLAAALSGYFGLKKEESLTKTDFQELQAMVRKYREENPLIPDDQRKDGLQWASEVAERAGLTSGGKTGRLGNLLKGFAGPKLGQHLAMCGLLAAASNELKSPEDALAFGRDVYQALGHSKDVMRSASATTKFFRLGSLTKGMPALARAAASTSRICGPLGSMLATGVDSVDAYKSFARGDYIGGAGSAGMALGGGLMTAAAIPGPWSPFLFAAGAGVSLVGWIAKFWSTPVSKTLAAQYGCDKELGEPHTQVSK